MTPAPAPEQLTQDTPRLVLMCGLPFAGKSTLARAIATAFGHAMIEVDAVNRERGHGSDDDRLTRAEWAAAYRESYRRMNANLADDRSVVFDATNFRRMQRDQIRRVAAPHAPRTVIVWVTTPETEIAARRWRNRVSPERPNVHDLDFDEVRQTFQPPGPDEPTLRFDGTQPIAGWLERHARDLQ